MTIENPSSIRVDPCQSVADSLDLAPLTRLLVQREEDHRAGMTMATSDVRALVNEVNRLRTIVESHAVQVHLALRAFIDHDLEALRKCLDAIAGKPSAASEIPAAPPPPPTCKPAPTPEQLADIQRQLARRRGGA